MIDRTLFARTRLIALLVGLAAAIACIFAAISPATRAPFFSAYLFAYLFWLGVSLGSLVLIMLHNLTGGEWGTLVRRVADPAARLLPLMLLFFLPILFGMHELFPWARPEAVAASEALRHRQPYLNVPFFLIRLLLYFAIWITLDAIVRHLGRRAVITRSERFMSHLRGWSAAGLVLYMLTMTNAGYDWAMSRDTDFYSTVFGFIITVGQTLSATAFAILLLAALNKQFSPPLMAFLNKKPEQNPPEAGAPSILNDVGNILLTLVILWAYVSFMQLLVIWMGNKGEDNGYYVKRGLSQENPWRWFALALIILHFFVPFFILLFRGNKKYLPTLTVIAGVVFFAHLMAQYWLIAPNPDLQGPHFALTWMDAATPLAIGGLWFAAYLTLLPRSLAALPLPAPLSLQPQPPRATEGLHHA
jgi:hypothetical protein